MSTTMRVEEEAQGDYTQDGTFDLKGRPVLRSNTGKWKACYFIVGKNLFWHHNIFMAILPLSTNIRPYLTEHGF